MSPTDLPETITALSRDIQRCHANHRELAGVVAELGAEVARLAAEAEEREVDPPRSWLLAEDPEQARKDVADLVEWLARVYLRFSGAALPSCWLWHADVIEELWCLRCAHREAYAEDRTTYSKASDWHDRLRPGVVKRLAPLVKGCDLSRHLADSRPPRVPLASAADQIARAHALSPYQPPTPTADQITEADHLDNHQHTS